MKVRSAGSRTAATSRNAVFRGRSGAVLNWFRDRRGEAAEGRGGRNGRIGTIDNSMRELFPTAVYESDPRRPSRFAATPLGSVVPAAEAA